MGDKWGREGVDTVSGAALKARRTRGPKTEQTSCPDLHTQIDQPGAIIRPVGPPWSPLGQQS